jgi:hypothetical protein
MKKKTLDPLVPNHSTMKKQNLKKKKIIPFPSSFHMSNEGKKKH